MPVSVREPRRKALLIGVKTVHNINKFGLGWDEVPGAHRDTENLRAILTMYGYKEQDITTLIDDDKLSPEYQPTEKNIRREMRNLVKGAVSGDEVAFAFSGHGAQIPVVKDTNEEDGLDEILLPVDATGRCDAAGNMKWSNFIIDDDIRATFGKLPPGARCVMIFDCCHSGTAGDLPRVLMPEDKPSDRKHGSVTKPTKLSINGAMPATRVDPVSGFTTSRQHLGHQRGPVPAMPKLTSWSACRDADNTTGNSKGGIFVRSFCKALARAHEKGRHPTHGQLLYDLQARIDKLVAKLQSEGIAIESIPTPQLGSLEPEKALDMPFRL